MSGAESTVRTYEAFLQGGLQGLVLLLAAMVISLGAWHGYRMLRDLLPRRLGLLAGPVIGLMLYSILHAVLLFREAVAQGPALGIRAQGVLMIVVLINALILAGILAVRLARNSLHGE